MLQSRQKQLQLDLQGPGSMKASMVPNMFDARKWRRTKLNIDHDTYRTQCANEDKILRQARLKILLRENSIVCV